MSTAMSTATHRGHDQRPDQVPVFTPGSSHRRAVTLPRNRVNVTAAGSSIASYGVLADRLASSDPVDRPGRVGIDDRQVGGLADLQRPALIGQTDDLGGPLAHHPRDVAPGQQPRPHHGLGDDRQRRLQSEHAGARGGELAHFSCSACGA